MEKKFLLEQILKKYIRLTNIYLNKCNKLPNSFYLGGQDCSNYKTGPYTGDTSASMLRDVSCNFCLVGHSERRHKFGETD